MAKFSRVPLQLECIQVDLTNPLNFLEVMRWARANVPGYLSTEEHRDKDMIISTEKGDFIAKDKYWFVLGVRGELWTLPNTEFMIYYAPTE